MSASKFRYTRVCDNCKKPFEAQKITTRYCSHACNAKHYKVKLRLENIAAAEQDTLKHMPNVQTPPEIAFTLKDREFLSVPQAGKLLGCSRQAVYHLIHSGKLKSINIATRKTIIRRSDIDLLFA